MKELKISAIREGAVIDHISPENAFKVVEILNLKDKDDIVMVGVNLQSKKIGKKGVIKIGNSFPTKEEIDKIALIAPEANLNIIKDYNVISKERVKIPDVLEVIIRCANPKCITNAENHKTKFYVLEKSPLRMRCHYCERIMEAADIELV
ncbi:MAG: aspartate carbamoyltransferase regulatory subunit [Candidatus Aenigmarchaeota archaeon]|nr:aspartate carbamoyltransferase regulatory subunit [Candidatus Aenigmarchaeota archaeon]